MSKKRDLTARIGIIILCVGACMEVAPEASWAAAAIPCVFILAGAALIWAAAHSEEEE